MDKIVTDDQRNLLVKEGVETIEAGANLVQGLISMVLSKPLYAVGALVVLGMVSNKSGGLKLGKVFDLRI